MSTKTNPGRGHNRRKLDAVLIQLSSQRPSDIWRGMEQVQQWLKEDPEDKEVYGVLLDAVQKNRELRDQVRAVLTEMMQNGSQSAEKAIRSLPSGLQDFLADADDAYYAAEYERAINLYRQVLRLDPDNERAKDHIAKAEIKRITGDSVSGLPRAAEQFYRRARSYIAARDVVTAMNLLSAAIEAARAKDMPYPEAEEALNNMQNLLTADEYRQKARKALDNRQWNEAIDLYNKGLRLDSTNDVMKKERDSLQDLLHAEAKLNQRGVLKVLLPVRQLQNVVESARIVLKPDNSLLNSVEKQLRQIGFTKYAGLVFISIVVIFLLYWNGSLGSFLIPAPSDTPVETQTAQTATATIPTNTEVNTIEPAPPTTTVPISTNTSPPTPTETLSPTPTEVTLGIGYVNIGVISTWDAPNGKFIERLEQNHPLIILEKRDATGFTWYRCRWESSGVMREGWILAEYITFGAPPTPRP